MLLYFMRHAEAEDTPPGRTDADRRLTDKGLRRAHEAGLALQALGVQLDLILTSPLVRARQTAEVMAEVLGVSLAADSALADHVSLRSLQDLLEGHDLPDRVMLVGHEPDFSAVVGELIGGAAVEMKKGAIAALDCRTIARGGALLQWLASGRHLSLMAK
jgi:phosphohistidine phosphatase